LFLRLRCVVTPGTAAGQQNLQSVSTIAKLNGETPTPVSDRQSKIRRYEMQGQIIKFAEDLGFGVIEAEDGERYRFAKTDVKNLNGKLVGHEVDFLIQSRRSKDVFLLQGTPWTAFGPQARD
jgi:cold shock CspA family protein